MNNSTPADLGRQVLKVYQDANIRAGQGVLFAVLTYRLRRQKLSGPQIMDGVEYAIQRGWIVRGKNDFYILADNASHLG